MAENGRDRKQEKRKTDRVATSGWKIVVLRKQDEKSPERSE